MGALLSGGYTVTIVSNNSAAAVEAFVTAHGLREYYPGRHRAHSARSGPPEALLKPHPHLVRKAINERATGPGSCVLIGDSTTDVEAAHRAGTAVIAYANKPGKRQALDLLGPDAITDDLHEIHTAASAHPAR